MITSYITALVFTKRRQESLHLKLRKILLFLIIFCHFLIRSGLLYTQICLAFLIIKKVVKNKRIPFTCEKWLVTTLTTIYKIWVCLNHETCFQPRPHTAVDLFSEYFKPSNKSLVPPDSMNRWTNFPFSAENMLQFKRTFLLRLSQIHAFRQHPSAA